MVALALVAPIVRAGAALDRPHPAFTSVQFLDLRRDLGRRMAFALRMGGVGFFQQSPGRRLPRLLLVDLQQLAGTGQCTLRSQ